MDALDSAYAAVPVSSAAPVAAPSDPLDAAYANLSTKGKTSLPITSTVAATPGHGAQLMADIDQVNHESTNPLIGLGEAGLNIVTGLGSSIVGGYRGVAALATGQGLEAAANAARSTQSDYTYQPRTGIGRLATDGIGAGMGLIKDVTGGIGGVAGQGAGIVYDKGAGALGIDTHGAGVLQGRTAGEAIGEVAPDIYGALEGARAGLARPISVASDSGIRAAADAFTPRPTTIDYDVPAFVRNGTKRPVTATQGDHIVAPDYMLAEGAYSNPNIGTIEPPIAPASMALMDRDFYQSPKNELSLEPKDSPNDASGLSLVPKDIAHTGLTLTPLDDGQLSLVRQESARSENPNNPVIDPILAQRLKQRIKTAQEFGAAPESSLSLEPKFGLTPQDAIASSDARARIFAPSTFSLFPRDSIPVSSEAIEHPYLNAAPRELSLAPKGPAEIAGDTSDIDAVLKSVGVETPAKSSSGTDAVTPIFRAPTDLGRTVGVDDASQPPSDTATSLAMQRYAEAQSLMIPMQLTEGMATGDIHKISNEHNMRAKIPAIADRFNTLNDQIIQNLDAARAHAAPDVGVSGVANDQALVDSIKNIDAPIRADISAKYKALEDANGGQFPLNGKDFVDTADANLAKQNKGYFLPSEMKGLMEGIRKEGNMTYNDFESLRTILGNEQRKAARAGDGNAEHAVNIVRSSLESLPMSDETASIKPLADAARQAAADRFVKIASDPAYKAAINDGVAVGEPSPVADGFISKYVVNGKTANVHNLAANLSADPAAAQIVAAGVLDHLKSASGIDLRSNTGNISQAGLNKAINALGEKKGIVLDPKSTAQIDTLGNVARYTQQQPRGSYVNNSNTFVAGVAAKGKKAIEMGGNVMVPGLGLGTEAMKILERRADAKIAKRILGPMAGADVSASGNIAAAAAQADRLASGGTTSTAAPTRPVLTVVPAVRQGIISGSLRPAIAIGSPAASQDQNRR